MTIYNIEEKLLDFLRVRQHTQLTERDITDALHISHGTFSAVRKRLIDAGALKCARVGRKLLFRVIDATDGQPAVPAQVPTAPPSAEAAPASAAIAPPSAEAAPPDGVQEPPPRVCGWFPSVDDWVSILMQRLGDVAADQIDDEEYSVVLMTDFTEQRYTVKESAGGIEVS
ncbi:MAG: hypothetical protein ACFNUI_08400 [Negativicutes bacterium]